MVEEAGAVNTFTTSSTSEDDSDREGGEVRVKVVNDNALAGLE